MSTATLSHQSSPARKAAERETSEAPARALTAAERDAHDTRMLATITGVATVIILVFFLTLMWILSGYGPTA